MEIIAGLLEAQLQGTALVLSEPASTRLVALLLQQAVEKIDRLRQRAFGLLRRLICRTGTVSPSRCVELAYRRVCHGENYHAAAPGSELATESSSTDRPLQAWPFDSAEVLQAALRDAREVSTDEAVDATDERLADRSAAIFDSLVPLLSRSTYRPALTLGIVVSMGGLTEYTAKGAKQALLQYLQESGEGEPRASAVCGEVNEIFDRIGISDAEPEAKRLLAPLFTTTGVLLAQSLFPEALAPDLLERAMAAVRSSRDIARLRASIPVFVGLLCWPGAVRRKAMSVLLQFLGYSFPTVRQATAQALYIRLLEESGEMDFRAGDAEACKVGAEPGTEPGQVVSAAALAEVSELISVTPWGTDNEEVLATALRETYGKLGFQLPTSGRSILAPKKPKEDRRPKGAEYADLVRECHY